MFVKKYVKVRKAAAFPQILCDESDENSVPAQCKVSSFAIVRFFEQLCQKEKAQKGRKWGNKLVCTEKNFFNKK